MADIVEPKRARGGRTQRREAPCDGHRLLTTELVEARIGVGVPSGSGATVPDQVHHGHSNSQPSRRGSLLPVLMNHS